MPETRIHSTILKKTDGSQHIAYAEVYAPMRVDTQKDAMEADEIELSAHNFLLKGRLDRIDVLHNFKPSGCKIVESFIARDTDPDFIPGSWVLGVKVFDDDLWEKIEKGELNGLSFGTTQPAVRSLGLITKSHPIKGSGVTEASGAGLLRRHSHPVTISFDKHARVISTRTGEALGHTHPITKTTATDMNLDHAHRLIFEVN
jgi:hypothetical protein